MLKGSGGCRDAHSVFVLSIGVGGFDDGADVEELGFVSSRMDEVRSAFEQLGARVEAALDADEGEVEALLRRWLVEEREPADVTVVHLIGHGRTDRSGRLGFVARDDRDVDVDRWIEKAQQEVERGGNRRRVVFLVDTCSAGAATGRQQISELGSERGVWVLGASVSSSPTERGRFSGWIATALHRLRDRDFSLNAEAISFTLFVQSLTQVVRADTAGQRMSLGFSLTQGDGDWSFLPTPQRASLTPEQIRLRRRSLGYVPGEEDLRRDLASRIAAGEEIGDALYFIDRASGRGLVPVDTGAGFFSGRAAELKQYMVWQAGDSPLLTVTGAAGAGKSGLLGVVVCAAHPDLRGRFRELWASAEQQLPEVAHLVALHARQRSPQQVIDTIAGHARLQRPKDEGEDGTEDGTAPDLSGSSGAAGSAPWTATLLRKALELEGKNRLIVLDAVDESTDPQSVLRVVAELIAPTERDGVSVDPPCRILLGGRREVIDALSAVDEMPEIPVDRIDLDTADPLAVEEDVRRYIAQLLATREPYATGAASEFVDLLAKQGAQGIVRGLRPDSPWGPFLLAGLYVHYLMTLKYPPQDKVNAEAHAGRASAHLPDLLEAVLSARDEEFPSLRAVLAILARSRGDGMPRTALRRCLRALNADGITDDQFLGTLREASPFLRTGIDPVSKEALYRIFQQGLADYLHDHPVDEDPWDGHRHVELERRVLRALVDPYMADPDERSDRWESADNPAEPYVFRHALGHVTAAGSAEHAEALLTDPYFLIRFDPRQDHRALDLARSERAATYIRLLNASWSTHAQLSSGTDRAWVFAFDAARLNLPEHQKEFARIEKELAYQPESVAPSFLWAEGGRAVSNARIVESGHPSVTRAAFSPDGALFATAGHVGVRVMETETWRQITPLIGDSLDDALCDVVFSPDGRLLAFAAGSWTRNIQLWDVHNRVLVGKPWRCHTGTVATLAFSPDSRLLAVGSEDLDVSVWDITGDHPVDVARLDGSEDTTQVAFSPDGRFLAVCGDAGLTLWRTDGWEAKVPLSREKTLAVAFSAPGGYLAGLHEGRVTIWSGDTFDRPIRIEPVDADGRSLACSPDGSLLAVGGWSALQLIEVSSRRAICRLASGSYTVTAAFHPADASLLVSTSGSDGSLRLWSAFADETELPQPTQFQYIAAAASPDGRLLAAYESDRGCLTLRDPATGRELAPVPLKWAPTFGTLRFSPDSRILTILTYDGILQVVRTGSLPPPEIENIHIGGTVPHHQNNLQFSPDSRLIALSMEEPHSRTSVIKVWDSVSLRLTARIPLPSYAASFGFAGPDRIFVSVDRALAVYTCDGTITEGHA
ncbi:WD40 repeat domain-containing protein [Streptomyces sp. S.PNR 29]|uniref:WD40 repeat domain-containing protein n=1 Tax=Streptomyces sp. S.PNR 29 TaxID=2973805 RepID=UPI0025B22BCC|nr:WD40 repeat domain-containing protein [Streptomyces sp. S.PNR 29]MDN0197258.1 hypothetical protein [Streptomyces sp. S.PNR 29]